MLPNNVAKSGCFFVSGGVEGSIFFGTFLKVVHFFFKLILRCGLRLLLVLRSGLRLLLVLRCGLRLLLVLRLGVRGLGFGVN